MIGIKNKTRVCCTRYLTCLHICLYKYRRNETCLKTKLKRYW